ncbi:putative small nuclear ribonucleoprotein [Pseudovirgaria hyperparasitica]|uniref:U6 snRNA-associated Sm-like protein LSm1 n=1 Tax=Pseudovirgaria hyperparasitica TaxID=470096 RepID=A0A6A6WDI9_9PEZI|nr:putative small nuclear ribonucleoprotein [Pseudovirgaria hyperparasitica]KAF2760635.1 putative small nuclear ribonucleoprotein [Pseudovirgaria hyperparasitica]
MENLSLNDPPPGSFDQAPQQPPVPLLPPQMFTTAAQLLDLTDKKLMVALRDGKKLIGVLRSWDQFGNLVLQGTVERMYVQNLFADVPRGVFLIRGENVLLLGEIDLDREDDIPKGFQEAPADHVFQLLKKEKEAKKEKDKTRHARLRALGFEGEQGVEGL